MTVQLATGKTSMPVTSASDRRLYAGEGGLGCYAHKIGKMCAATLDGPNKLVVQNGSLMIHGAHVDLLGNTEFTIPSGLQGKKRATVCGVYVYAMADGAEDAEVRVYTGEAVESGEVPDPEYPTGDLNDGATETFMPLWRVVTDGINALEPEPMFDVRLPMKEFCDSQSQYPFLLEKTLAYGESATVEGISKCKVVYVSTSSTYADDASNTAVLCVVRDGWIEGSAATPTGVDLRVIGVNLKLTGDTVSNYAVTMGEIKANGTCSTTTKRKIYSIRKVL